MKSKKQIHRVFNLLFLLFLIIIFFNAFYPQDSRMDLYTLKESNSIIFDGFTYQAYPIMPSILYKIIPTEVFIFLSPFTIVGIYLLFYYLVSKEIVYLFPLTILIPLFYSTLLPGTFDWLLLPIIYHFIKKGRDNISLLLGIIMVYFHAHFSLIYLTLLLGFLHKWKMLKKIILFSLPQMIPLIYFSRHFIFAKFNRFPWLHIVKLLDYEITRFYIDGTYIRIIILISYSFTFLILIHRKK